MSLLHYFQSQKIDDFTDDLTDNNLVDDKIELNEQIDESSLEKYWDNVAKDISKDPEWYTFDNK